MTEDTRKWGYRMVGGKVEGRIFEDGKLPAGWEDSPAKCTPKKGRPKKVSNGDGL